jgi:hypothetical protein
MVGGALADGALRAQAPDNAPESIYGVWSETSECRPEDSIIAITPRLVAESGARVTAHTAVTLASVADGVLATPARFLMSFNRQWHMQEPEARAWVFQRRGDTPALVRRVDRDGRDEAPPADARGALWHACR